MNTVFLVRNVHCGTILGVYSTMELALENEEKTTQSVYIDTVALDMPIIEY